MHDIHMNLTIPEIQLQAPVDKMHPADWARLTANPLTREIAETHTSPTGRHTLVITPPFPVMEGNSWRYTRGVVFDPEGVVILDLVRGYGSFPFAFHVRHKGETYEQEYFIASAPRYTGTWVYELESSRPGCPVVEGSRSGNAFCVGSYHVSPDHRHMVVCGCVWAGSWEYLVFNLESTCYGYMSCISVGDDAFVGDEDPHEAIEWLDDEVVIRARWDDDEEEKDALKWMNGMEYRIPLLKPVHFPHPEGCRCGACES